MSLKLPFAALLFLSLAIVSCKVDPQETPIENPPENPPGTPPVSTQISFENMAIGQKSRYIGLVGQSYFAGDKNDFTYTDDTLELEIVAQDEHGFLVREKLIYVGDTYHWFEAQKDSVYQYYLNVVDNTLQISSKTGSIFVKTRLFGYQIRQDGLALSKNISPKVEILGWKTGLGTAFKQRSGYAENYSLFGVNYPFLNVLVENSPMATDRNGETYVYNKTVGLVRFSTYSYWTDEGPGWDLLP